MVEIEATFMEFMLGRKMGRIKGGTLWGIRQEKS
jgi:hypothetical protein